MLVDEVFAPQQPPHNNRYSIGHNEGRNNLETSELTEGRHSQQSKQTPHSISKMNITELKQSLSQTLNRDFIEPPS